ncbi:hypothetical protein [Streptomyces violaceusniger]
MVLPAAVIGYHAPLFGLPSPAFVLVDLTVGMVRRHRAKEIA